MVAEVFCSTSQTCVSLCPFCSRWQDWKSHLSCDPYDCNMDFSWATIGHFVGYEITQVKLAILCSEATFTPALISRELKRQLLMGIYRSKKRLQNSWSILPLESGVKSSEAKEHKNSERPQNFSSISWVDLNTSYAHLKFYKDALLFLEEKSTWILTASSMFP